MAMTPHANSTPTQRVAEYRVLAGLNWNTVVRIEGSGIA
jgi:hypothetical protein